jgi:hypothetical protein
MDGCMQWESARRLLQKCVRAVDEWMEGHEEDEGARLGNILLAQYKVPGR